MQFSKLEVGTDYLYSNSTKWMEYAHVDRVRLVDLDHWASNYKGVFKSEGGKLVHVQTVREDGTLGKDRYVAPVRLRGVWADAIAERDRAHAEKQQAAYDRSKRTEAAKHKADGLTVRAGELGLTVQPRPINDRNDGFVTVDHKFEITSKDLEAFLRWHEGQGPRPGRDAAGHRLPCSRIECQAGDGE